MKAGEGSHFQKKKKKANVQWGIVGGVALQTDPVM